LLERCEGDGDRRIGYVRLRKEQLPLFLQVHAESMQIAQNISDIIGPEDTDHFIRIVNKLAQSGYHL
jgi:DNA-binding MarR family transcriptional regulator